MWSTLLRDVGFDKNKTWSWNENQEQEYSDSGNSNLIFGNYGNRSVEDTENGGSTRIMNETDDTCEDLATNEDHSDATEAIPLKKIDKDEDEQGHNQSE